MLRVCRLNVVPHNVLQLVARRSMCQSRFVEINVATELSYEGHFKQAQSLLESSLRESLSNNGPMHQKTISLERNIASLLIEQGNTAKATEICHNAVKSIAQLSSTVNERDKHLINFEVAGFKSILASVHLENRQYIEAEKLYREVIEEQERIIALRLGNVSLNSTGIIHVEDLLTSYTHLGRALLGLDQFDESEKILRTTLKKYMDKYKSDEVANKKEDVLVPLSISPSEPSSVTPVAANHYSIGTMRCMDALATCLMLKESEPTVDTSSNGHAKAEAEQLFRQIVLNYQSNTKYGESHRLTLRAAANLGTFLESLGDGSLDEAEDVLSNTLEKQKAVLGNQHPDTLITMSYLGELYDNNGFIEEARALWLEAMQAHVQLYGDGHTDTIRCKQHYAGLLAAAGEYEEAELLLQDVVSRRCVTLGEQHYDTFSARKALAETYFGLQRYDDAEEQYQKCLSALRSIFNNDDDQFDILVIKGSLGLLYMSMSVQAAGGVKTHREELAYKNLQASCDGLKMLLGDEDLHYLRALGNLATYHLTVTPTAVQTMTEAVDVSKLDRSNMAHVVAKVIPPASNLRIAEEMLRTVITGMTAQLGPQHDYTIGYSSNLAMLLFNEQRNFKEAADLFRDVCSVFVKKYTHKHVKTLTVLYPLSICLAYSGQIDEATHCAVIYCEHCQTLYGEHSKELQAGLAILDQLRNYKITPSKDKSPDLRAVYGTNDVEEDIQQRVDGDDIAGGFDDDDDAIPMGKMTRTVGHASSSSPGNKDHEEDEEDDDDDDDEEDKK